MNDLDYFIEHLKGTTERGYQTQSTIGNVGEAFAVDILGFNKMEANNTGFDVFKMVSNDIQTMSVKTTYLSTRNFQINGIQTKKKVHIDSLLVVVLDPNTHRPLQYVITDYKQAVSDASKDGVLSLGRYNKSKSWQQCN